nr:MAG TPA: hypothetical protein [Crassvirales sp.]
MIGNSRIMRLLIYPSPDGSHFNINRVRYNAHPNTNKLFTPKCLPPRLLRFSPFERANIS